MTRAPSSCSGSSPRSAPPYEKSQALDLHDDAITPYDPAELSPAGTARDEDRERGLRKVVFEPFMGVGPRRYFDLFSMKLSNGFAMKRKQKPAGLKEKWRIGNDSVVRVPMSPFSYLEREAQLVQQMTALMEKMV